MYDAIVVGARCAGAPTAMLLARKGYDVLLVDRARFPSDTLSTHAIQAPGLASLHEWGLLDRVADGGTPILKGAIGTIPNEGTPVDLPPTGGVAGLLAPRRTRLDKILVDAAREAGAEVREQFTFEDVTTEGGRVTGIVGRNREGETVTERARYVIGADGRNSTVAQRVGAGTYNEVPPLGCGYYSYWSGFASDTTEAYFGRDVTVISFPTDDELTVVICVRPPHFRDEMRRKVEESYLSSLREMPLYADRLASATREERIYGASDLTNFFRESAGPGWALVGDAGHYKDPTPAEGISDAFYSVDLLVDALDRGLQNEDETDAAVAEYPRLRDERAQSHYEACVKISSFDNPPEERAEAFMEEAINLFTEAAEHSSTGATA